MGVLYGSLSVTEERFFRAHGWATRCTGRQRPIIRSMPIPFWRTTLRTSSQVALRSYEGAQNALPLDLLRVFVEHVLDFLISGMSEITSVTTGDWTWFETAGTGWCASRRSSSSSAPNRDTRSPTLGACQSL
jgi:hypothetical protein